jgi:hypothetical protein
MVQPLVLYTRFLKFGLSTMELAKDEIIEQPKTK